MPAIPSPLPLQISDIYQVEQYLGDEKHRNHRGYRIQIPVGHGIEAKAFGDAVSHALTIINGPRTGKEQVRVAARWYVLTFAKESYLTAEERASYEQMARKILGLRRFFLTSWHQHKTNGEADLNLLDPEIRLLPFPILDRPRSVNRLYRLRHASDAWTEKANQARDAIGKPRIPAVDPISDTSTTGLARLVRLLVSHLPANAGNFRRTMISATFKAAGFEPEDWEQSITGQLSIRRWPNTPVKKRKPRTFKITITELVAWVWLYLLRRIGKPKGKLSSKDTTRNTEAVIPLLRTAPEVIQRPDEPQISP